MPKVSDAYRKARRDEIVAAALRVLGRRSLQDLTMADIIEESGLSAGSVYSHFERKDELMELVAAEVVGARLELLRAPEGDPPSSPGDVVTWWLSALEADPVAFGTLVQVWSEATSDPAMGALVQRRMAQIETAFAAVARRWLVAEGRDASDAAAVANAMLTVCQGYIVRTALLGPQDPVATVAAVGLLGR